MPPDSVAALYDTHAPALYRFLLSLCGSEADTLDLLQDLFVRLVRQRRDSLDDPQAFLFRAARNLFLDQLRRKAHRRKLLDAYGGELSSTAHAEPKAPSSPESKLAVARALACLPEDQRAVVHLKIWENLTFARIAEILGIPPNTAASRYRYAMDRLRLLLTNQISGHAR